MTQANEKNLTKELERQIMIDYRSGDLERMTRAQERLIEGLEGYIGNFINKKFNQFKGQYYHDLYSEGVVAIIQHMGDFDPEKGTATTFFTFHLQHAMSAFVNSQTNRSTAYYSALMNKVKDAQRQLEESEKPVTAENIAIITGMSMKKIVDTMKRIEMTNEVSYDNEENNLDNMLAHVKGNPEHEYLEKEKKETLIEAMNSLTEIEQEVLRLKFGFDEEGEGKERSQVTIAKMLGLPINQVKRLIACSLRKLKEDKKLKEYIAPRARQHEQAVLNNSDVAIAPEGILSVYAQLGKSEVSVSVVSDVKKRQTAKPKKNSDEEFILRF